MTKKGHQKFWLMKIEKLFWEMVKFGKLSTKSETFFWNRGECETEWKCIIASGVYAPARTVCTPADPASSCFYFHHFFT